MKKIFTLLCILTITGGFAQTTVDTFYWSSGNTAALYSVAYSNGYIAGTDGYGLTGADAEIFHNSNAGQKIKIIGARYWFGAKAYTSNDTNSILIFNLYKLDSTYQNAEGNFVPAPGTIISRDTVKVRDLKASLTLADGANDIIMSPPVFYDAGFAFGFDVTHVSPGDTVGLVTSANGQAHGTEQAMAYLSVGDVGGPPYAWHSFLDSINGWNYNVDLAIFPILDLTQYDTIPADVCLGNSYPVGNNQFDITGTYLDTMLVSAPATAWIGGPYDSVAVLNLTVNPDTTVLLYGDTLFTARVTTGATYEWIDCAAQQPVTGDTLSTFKPIQPGSYALRITQDGCTGTSSCYAALVSGIQNLHLIPFEIRPNPARDVCTVYPGDAHGTWNGALYTIQGQLLENLFTGQNMQPYTFSIGSLPQGIYLVKVNTEDGQTGIRKLVVE